MNRIKWSISLLALFVAVHVDASCLINFGNGIDSSTVAPPANAPGTLQINISQSTFLTGSDAQQPEAFDLMINAAAPISPQGQRWKMRKSEGQVTFAIGKVTGLSNNQSLVITGIKISTGQGCSVAVEDPSGSMIYEVKKRKHIAISADLGATEIKLKTVSDTVGFIDALEVSVVTNPTATSSPADTAAQPEAKTPLTIVSLLGFWVILTLFLRKLRT